MRCRHYSVRFTRIREAQLTDHWGQRRSLLLFNGLSLAGYLLVLVWHHWLALVLGSFYFWRGARFRYRQL